MPNTVDAAASGCLGNDLHGNEFVDTANSRIIWQVAALQSYITIIQDFLIQVCGSDDAQNSTLH